MVHADLTSTAAAAGRTGRKESPRSSAMVEAVARLFGMPSPYRHRGHGGRQPNARTARVRIAFFPVGEFGTVHFSLSNC